MARQGAKRTRLRAVHRTWSAGGRVEDDEGGVAGGTADPNDAGRDAAGPSADLEATPSWLRGRIEGRSQPLEICRFLAAEDADGRFGPAMAGVDGSNRCLALGDPTPQSSRQQELVCLAAAHHNCPRYLRGLLLESTPPPAPRREPISAAVIGSSLLLVAAIAATFGFLAVRGGFGVELQSPSPRPAVALSSPAASPSVLVAPSASVEPSVALTSSPSPSPEPTPSPSPEPTPSPSPEPTAAPTPRPPSATPTPQPTSDRFAVLTKCPSTPDCWIYVIRSGDNLFSIAHWFGVSLDRIYQMNPWARTSGLKAGQHLRIPTPTR
jgi:LysM repeat protein